MRDDLLNRIFVAVLFLFSGILAGLLIGPFMSKRGVEILLGAGVLLIIVAVYSVIRFFIVTQRKSLKTPGETGKKSEVGFVVDTFQELVGKLKEKERELEKLRSIAEDRAVRLETYNENILQSVPSGVVTIDNSMKIKSINHAALKTLGMKLEDVLDKDCKDILDEPLLSIALNKKITYRGEHPYFTRDKRHIWLGVTTSQLRNVSNEAIGFIMVFTDLTDVKALQTQMELKKRLTQLGEMSAGIAHELRNPMSVISGYARLLGKKVDESNQSIVKSILAEIEGMDRIISEFLAFAKPTDLNRTLVNLSGMIEETVSSAVSGNSAVKVSVRGEGPVSVMADEVLLKQALTNVLINAVEAMPEGGNLDIEISGLSDMIKIKIRDTGSGIPQDIRQKIFLPFYTTKEKGIGLGLAIVQKIVVSHGGSVDFESGETGSTTFIITLPAIKQ